jgi:hypothetical protein
MNNEQTTNRIFMTCLEGQQERDQVKLAVFLKAKNEHLKNLMGFLRNQNINCSEIAPAQRKEMQEFAYFDQGFFISIKPNRWSFYELKSFIQTYANTCEEEVVLRDTLLEELKTCDEDLIFDDRFYVQLTRKIDNCENQYYQENMSISLFLNGILRILRENLQLYWAAVKLTNNQPPQADYFNQVPPSLERREIIKACDKKTSEFVIKAPIEFCGEPLADFFLRPGPFSPEQSVINKFLSQVIMQIDSFIYGHINHKSEIFCLKKEIEELKKQHTQSTVLPPEREQKTRKKLRLIIIGGSHLSTGQILSAFSQFGFEKQNIELHTEWDKYRSFDTNNLLAVRSRYDGIMLGPIPHKMKGNSPDGDDLIVQMQNYPDKYPSFVVVRDKRGDLKITKSSLKEAIKELISKTEKVGSYQ